MNKAREASTLITLENVGALKRGHFVLGYGGHTKEYIDMLELCSHQDEMWKICRELADMFLPNDVDVVTGVATGGNFLALGVAYWISQLKYPRAKKDPGDSPIRTALTEKTDEGEFSFTHEHGKLISGKKVLVIEDVTQHGESILKVVHEVHRLGGKVLGVGVVWNRCALALENLEQEADLNNFRYFHLVYRQIPALPSDICELCKKNIPVDTEVGHGKEFLDHRMGLT